MHNNNKCSSTWREDWSSLTLEIDCKWAYSARQYPYVTA